MSRPLLRLIVPWSCAGALLMGADQSTLVERLKLEAHGYVSFGYLDSERNNWLGGTEDGTGQFWEAAANVITRPADRLRLGAQLFARDLTRYDNGRVTLDWAYADYRFADAIGLQVGRVKLPIGLYNEALDIDAARAAVFLPVPIYALRSRDLYMSTDGGKVYGAIDLAAGGSLDYALYGGSKPIDSDSGFAAHMSEQSLGAQVDDIGADWVAGFMVHWNTPVPGLGLRLSGTELHGFFIDGTYPGPATLRTDADYQQGVLSLVWEGGDWTVASEYLRLRGRGRSVIEPGATLTDLIDNTEGAYLSATWHARSWCEAYAAIEATWSDAYDRSERYAYAGVLALNLMPLPNWSLKAEVRGVRGTSGLATADEPHGFDDRWGVLALKTTVDF